MKAIIIAAGMGSRLGKLTKDIPKCMLKVAGKSMLERQVEVLRNKGIDDIIVVKGYKGDKIDLPGITYVENLDWENNNILASLFYAEKYMDGGFIFSYSDIIYDGQIVEKLLTDNTYISIVVDYDWRKRYRGRTLHPVSEAELVLFKDKRDSHALFTGKDKGSIPSLCKAEFIGLAKFATIGEIILRYVYHKALDYHNAHKDIKFHQAVTFNKAYLTDILQEIIQRGYTVNCVPITNRWIEIDTPQDLERAERWLS